MEEKHKPENRFNESNISLLNITGEYYEFENCFYFHVKVKDEEGFKYYPKKSIVCLLDPTLDQTFKYIFTYRNPSSSNRLISFLNSLLSKKYGEKIIKIEYCPNEMTNKGEKGRKNVIVFDIMIIAYFKSGKTRYIDIEMQTTYHNQLFNRWIKYANRIYSNTEEETLVLVLQIDDNKNNDSCWMCSPYIKTYTEPIHEEKISNVFEIINIDLNQIINIINKNEPIKFGKLEIEDEGKCWLKLIGLRAWNGLDGKGNKVMGAENYYCLPKIENASKEIIETMTILSTFSDSQKKEFIDFQKIKEKEFEDGFAKGNENGYANGKKESDLKTWLRLYRNKMDIVQYNDLYPNLQNVKEDDVKILFSKEPDLNDFINFLKENNIF